MINLATIEDIRDCSDKAREFYRDVMGKDEFHVEHFRNVMASLIKNEMAIVLKRETNGAIREAIGAVITPDCHTGKPTAMVSFWFVTGRYGLASGLVFMAFLGELRSRNVQSVFVSASLGPRYERVRRFLERTGFSPTDVYFRMNI
jgi:hypothetical protein